MKGCAVYVLCGDVAQERCSSKLSCNHALGDLDALTSLVEEVRGLDMGVKFTFRVYEGFIYWVVVDENVLIAGRAEMLRADWLLLEHLTILR